VVGCGDGVSDRGTTPGPDDAAVTTVTSDDLWSVSAAFVDLLADAGRRPA
jgi:hypothetical protein